MNEVKMSSHLSHDISRSLQLEWYKIRDSLFGQNHVLQNVPLAIQLASSCSHPDARWLTDACAGKDIQALKDLKPIFLALAGENDARALFFAFLCGAEDGDRLLLRSAQMGCAAAQAWPWHLGATSKDRFRFALLSASQGERDGYYRLGMCYRDGVGCVKDLEKAMQNYSLACDLESVRYCVSTRVS
jgi:TPR repeat protein